MDMDALCNRVREIAYGIHVFHGPGHLERIYENALVHRLTKAGVSIVRQCAIPVRDEDGTLIGQYVADLLVEGCLLIELKAATRIAPEHIAQILGYLKSTRLEYGLLLNFGSCVFEAKRFGSRAFVHQRFL
jgi:GxxExxY protein